MRLDCPIRDYCNKFTKSILAAGVLLLLTGLVFCNNGDVSVSPTAEASSVSTENDPIRQCHESSCRRRAKKNKKKQPPIQIQQRQMKERLSRINQKIEKLKEKRIRINVK